MPDLKKVLDLIAKTEKENQEAESLLEKYNAVLQKKKQLNTIFDELTSDSAVTLDEKKVLPAKTAAKVPQIDAAAWVKATANIQVQDSDPVIIRDKMISSFPIPWNPKQGLWSWHGNNEQAPNWFGRLLEVVVDKFGKNYAQWINELYDRCYTYDALFADKIPIDYKSHFADPKKKTKYPSGILMTPSDMKRIEGVVRLYDYYQERNTLTFTRVGWITKEDALSALDLFYKTGKPNNKIVPCPTEYEKKAMLNGSPLPNDMCMFKITRAAMHSNDELITYLNSKIDYQLSESQQKINSVLSSLDEPMAITIRWLLQNAVLYKRGTEYRIQIKDFKYHHVKKDLNAPFRDPFAKNASCAASKDGNTYRFQLPDYVREQCKGFLNVRAKPLIKVFEVADQIQEV